MAEIASIIITIGGLSVLFGAFDLMTYEGEEGELKSLLIKIVGGVLVAGVGVLLKYIGL